MSCLGCQLFEELSHHRTCCARAMSERWLYVHGLPASAQYASRGGVVCPVPVDTLPRVFALREQVEVQRRAVVS